MSAQVKLELFRFIIIGVFSSTINYLAFYFLYNFFSVFYILASGVGFVAGVFVGYGLNKNWTFQIKEKKKQYVLKYLIIYLVSLFLGLFFLNFLVQILDSSPELANALTIILTTCTNFIGTKFWVFKK